MKAFASALLTVALSASTVLALIRPCPQIQVPCPPGEVRVAAPTPLDPCDSICVSAQLPTGPGPVLPAKRKICPEYIIDCPPGTVSEPGPNGCANVCVPISKRAICPDISIGCPPGFVSEPDPANVCENICVRIAKREAKRCPDLIIDCSPGTVSEPNPNNSCENICVPATPA